MSATTPIDYEACWQQLAMLRKEVATLTTALAMKRPRPGGEGDMDVVDTIRCIVCAHFCIPLDLLDSKDRTERIAWPRQIAMHLTRQFTCLALADIGRLFGGRDHGTVLHSSARVLDRMQTEAKVEQLIKDLSAAVKNYGGKAVKAKAERKTT